MSSKRLVPYLIRSLPGWSFSRAIALEGSGPRRVAFHAVWVSDRDATYLGMALMRSTYGSPTVWPQYAKSCS